MAGYIGSKSSVVSSGVENKKVITATAGQTSFTGLTYSPNRVHVFQNGVRLVDGTDYTATNGTSLTLTVGASVNDQVVVVSYSGFTVGDVVPASTGGTFSNAVTIDADGATVLTVDRATSNGTIIDLQKSGSSVGVLGVNGDRIYLTNAQEGIMIDQSANNLSPTSSTGTFNDNAMGLGESGNRWKDLYLSGGAYLGGTGSANKLDDYEEGSFTPQYGTTASAPNYVYTAQSANYVKIGKMVFVRFYIRISSVITQGSGILKIDNLPFVAQNDPYNGWGGSVGWNGKLANWGSNPYNLAVIKNTDDAFIHNLNMSTGAIDDLQASAVNAGCIIEGSLMYETT
jgi:hypothetical protein